MQKGEVGDYTGHQHYLILPSSYLLQRSWSHKNVFGREPEASGERWRIVAETTR